MALLHLKVYTLHVLKLLSRLKSVLGIQKKQQKGYSCYEYEMTVFLSQTKKNPESTCSERSSTVNICII